MCFQNTIEALRPYLKTGIIAPDFIIEGIDPLLIGDLDINRGFEVKHFGMEAFGISDFKVEKIRVNYENFKVCCK